MDPAAPFDLPVDTFSNSFDQLFSANQPGFPPVNTATQPPSHQKSSSSPEPSTTTKSPTTLNNGAVPGSGINPRSCTTCRKRKVRCDKKHPCSNCHKAGIDCIFPRPGRAPRRSKKPPDSELLARLRRLEGVVQSLGKGVDGEDLRVEPESLDEGKIADSPQTDEAHAKEGSPVTGRLPGSSKGREIRHDSTTGLEQDMGRLFVGDGKSRYISNSFWANLTSQVAEMHDVLNDTSDEEEAYLPQEQTPGFPTGPQTHQMFIFGYSSAMITLRVLHPPKSHISMYWEIYKENVNPLIRMLHRPSVEKITLEAAENLDNLDKATEALMFSIYLTVVTSLSPEDCQSLLQQDKDVAIQRYRFGAEQALARAEFLETTELMVLQAFTLFLVSARRHDDTRFVWTMTGLATRIANAMGLHRDGAQFGLPPFETEMRRRLWWQVCTLDIRASEEQSSDPSITEQNFDTKLPANINDDDLWPEMTEAPVEREGCTEMTFDLLRYEITNTLRWLQFKPAGLTCPGRNMDNATIEEKERMIEKLTMYLEEKYLRHCDMTIPLQWVAANVARLILAKMWLVVHHPMRRADQGAGMSQDTKDRLFRTSVDVIRYSHTMESQRSTMKWGWLFRTYVQWHAVAWVLSELCVRTTGPDVEETWQLMDVVFNLWGDTLVRQNKGLLWKPIKKLMAKAKIARAKALEQERKFPLDGTLGPAGTLPLPRLRLPGVNEFKPFTPLPPTLHDTPSPRSFSIPSSGDKGTPASANNELPIPDPTDPWLNDPTLLQDPDENMNWEGWDEMVKDFSMEINHDQPVQFSMATWW